MKSWKDFNTKTIACVAWWFCRAACLDSWPFQLPPLSTLFDILLTTCLVSVFLANQKWSVDSLNTTQKLAIESIFLSSVEGRGSRVPYLFFKFFLFVLMTLIASIITFSKKKMKKRCYPRPSTWNPRPSTLDKKIDSVGIGVCLNKHRFFLCCYLEHRWLLCVLNLTE